MDTVGPCLPREFVVALNNREFPPTLKNQAVANSAIGMVAGDQMVAIFTGAGTGFERGSGTVLGASGLLGSAGFGRGGQQLLLNAANGNLLINRQDEFLVGRGGDVGVSRTYNSQGNQSDDNGDNWRQSTQRAVNPNGPINNWGGSVVYRSGDGSEIIYSWNGSAYVTTEGSGAYDRITFDGSTFRRVDSDSGVVETFEYDGATEWRRITSETDRSGNTISYGYSGNKLTSVTTANGGALTYSWSGNHITQVISGDGTATRYFYDAYDRLSQVDVELTGGGPVYSTTYTYYSTSTFITHISDTDGSHIAIVYDASGRVTSFTQVVSSGVGRTTNIAYGVGHTVVTDATGQSTTLYYNGSGALTQITAPPASTGAAQQVVQFGYNGNGDLTSVTDAAGQTSNYTYDGHGNLLTQTDRLGNTVTRTYNSADQVLTETRVGSDKDSAAANHTMRYVYDGANRLRYTISAEGEVTEYRLDGYGLTFLTLQYRTKFDLSGLGATTALSEAQLNAWSTSVDGTQIEQVGYAYDARGNVVQKVSFGGSNSPGDAHVSQGYKHEYFTYDLSGRLLSSLVAGQNTETYVYDGLGRMVAKTDVHGGTTTFAFNDAATQTVVTLANGLVQVSTYNKTGDLVNFTESGEFVAGGTAVYRYDQNGRLRWMTDATGRSFYYVYDKLGRKVADVSVYGQVTEYRYDVNDRVVATVRYAYATGAMAQVSDVNANIDIAAVRPAGHSSDLWSWSIYDKEGRVIEAIDGDGAVTTYDYDASGRLVKTTGYANKLAGWQLDGFKSAPPGVLVLPPADARDSVARVFYDRAGRAIGSLNGEGYLARTIYDGAGQKVQEIAYFNATNAALRASGSFQDLINSVGANPADQSTRYVYDQQGNLRFVIDTLNHVTEYVYEYASWLWSAFGPARQTIQYAGTLPPLANYTYAAVKAAVGALANDPSNRLSSAIYDEAGRLAYSISAVGSVVGYRYDALGQLTRKVEYARTEASTLLYSKQEWDNWTNVYAGADDRITRYYYSDRELRFTIDAEGYVTRTDYDEEGRETLTARWNNRVSADDSWTIHTVNGAVGGDWAGTSTHYDNAGRKTLVVDQAGGVRSYYYHGTGLLAWEIASEGGRDESRIYYVYDAAGRVTARYDAYGTAEQAGTSYSYDGLGNLTSVTDPNGRTTSYGYDHAGRKVRETNALGGVTTTEYNAFGDVIRSTDALNNATYSYYDNAGRLIATRNAENYVVETTYNAFGEVASVTQRRNASYTPVGYSWPALWTDPGDAITSFVYDRLGRLILTTDAEGAIEGYAYNAFGDRIYVRNKLGGVTVNSYDRRGLLVAQTQPVSSTRSDGVTVAAPVDATKFDPAYYAATYGDMTWATSDPATAEWHYNNYGWREGRNPNAFFDTAFYLAQNADIAAANINPFEHYRGWGAMEGRFIRRDLPAGVVAIGGVTTRFEYDSRGNRTAMIEAYGLAEQRTTWYVYDKADRLVEKRGDIVGYVDQNNHIGFIGGQPTERYGYDTRGNLIETIDANGARTLFYYDDLDRKVAEIGALGTLSTFAYDAGGNLVLTRVYGTPIAQPTISGGTAPAVPGGEYRETSYSYDALNRVRTTSVAAVLTGQWNGSVFVTTTVPLTTTYEYDALGNVTAVIDANGGVTRHRYDSLGRKIRTIDAEGYITGWVYDAAGNIWHERRWAAKAIDGYWDPSVSGEDRCTNFQYDRMGRRVTEWRYDVEAYGVNASGSIYGAGGTSTVQYSYNRLGLVTRKTEATGDYIDYTYDAAGRLLVERRAGINELDGANVVRPTVRYFYNGLGNLTRTEQGVEDAAQGGRVTRYLYGLGQRLLTLIDANGASVDYYYDAAGNVLRENYQRANSAGALTYEGILYTRDILGRVTAQTQAWWDGQNWHRGDIQQTAYNAYGDVSQRGINGMWQEQFAYDRAGRLSSSNAGDGVWRYYVHDRNGNQTAVLESEGSPIGGNTLEGAIAAATYNNTYHLGQVYVDGVNVTVSTFDGRNQQRVQIQLHRQINGGGGTVNLTTEQGYNPFGEIIWERDARGNYVNYTRNTMGRVRTIQRASVLVTSESGQEYWTNPTEYYYNDISGRLVGTRDANGNYTSRLLLAGTGYGESEALVSREFHADGGVISRAYDRFGDLRTTTDEVGRTTSNVYDAMGRLTEVHRPDGLIEFFAYDVLGQRIRHWNSFYGAGNVERTDYDVQGRIISQVAFGGDQTSTTYTWTNGLTTQGFGVFGGWVETTTYANGRTSVQQEDRFGRTVYSADLGGHQTWFQYDHAGRMVQRSGGETVTYSYYNTGLLASMVSGYGSAITAPNNLGETYRVNKTSYSYDAAGNKTTEQYTVEIGGWIDEGWYENYGYYGWEQYWVSNWQYSTNVTSYQNASATYDALGRMTGWSESGNNTTPTASISYRYDANGNVRRTYASYYALDQNGAAAYQTSQDYWYRYDAMNRVVTSKGQLAGGIVRGNQGIDITYNQAGERVRTTRTISATGQVYWEYYDPNMYGGWGGMTTGYLAVPYDAEYREDYSYDSGGRLSTVRVAQSGYQDNLDGTLTVTPPPGTGALKANYQYDGAGRLTHQIDWLGDGADVAYDHSLSYNAKGQVTSDVTVQRQGYDVVTTASTNEYGDGASYALGAPVTIQSSTHKNGTYQYSATTTNGFAWYAGAVQASTTYAQSNQAAYTSTYYYGPSGELTQVQVSDGRPHTIGFTNDMNGQAIRRDETDSNGSQGDPHEVWYRFNGKQMGYVGNNGTQNTDYQTSINQHGVAPGTGAFANGASSGSAYADFDQSFTGITSGNTGGAGGRYTVRTGDTLASIAAQLWGDSALWYRLAEANGLSGAGALLQGQQLTIPSGVTRATNNAATFNPYDPASILGDTSPTTPQPQKAAKRKGCGVLGQILLIAIAVAVTIVALPASGPVSLKVGALAGLAGSAASQGVGLVTGLQKSIDLKGLALAGISGGVAAGLGGVSGLSGATGAAGVAQTAVRGVLGSVITQGIGVAFGLQSKFDWAGVAAAGIGGAISGALQGHFTHVSKGVPGLTNAFTFGERALTNTAAGIANAAARSLVNGTDFGDNVLAALPDVIGQTIGSVVGDSISAATDPIRRADAQTKKALRSLYASAPEQSIDELRAKLIALSVEHTRSINGADAAEIFRAAAQNDPDLSSSYTAQARALQRAAIAKVRLDDGEALANLAAADAATNPTTAFNTDEISVTGNHTFGDSAANALISAQRYLNNQISPETRVAITTGLSVLRFGPVGAVGQYAVNQAIDASLRESGLDKVLSTAIVGIGETALGIIGGHGGEVERVSTAIAGPGDPLSIVEAAGTILGIAAFGGSAIVGARALYGRTPPSAPDRIPVPNDYDFIGPLTPPGWRPRAAESKVLSPFTERYLTESGGRWGGTATRQQNYAISQELEARGYSFPERPGGGLGPEEYIPGSGSRGGTYVDITGIAPNGRTVRIQTVTTLADGVTPTASEAAAAARIRAAFPNDKLLLVPKR